MDIKNNLFLFLSCKIINPTFENQTKETLTTKITVTDLKEDFILSESFIRRLTKSKIVEDITNRLLLKSQSQLQDSLNKKNRLVKIKKLDDATMAGTYESKKCSLFITEGDSALSTCLSGFSVTGRKYYGAFPLKGKPQNVRGEGLTKVKENEEIKNIVSALGLEFGKKYKDTKDLRYGKIVFMSDADCIDGDTLILTKRGYIPIKDVDYEDEVLTHTNEWKNIKNIIKTNKTNLIRLTINNEEYTFGENHKIPILRNGEITMMKAKYILKTDKVLKKKE